MFNYQLPDLHLALLLQWGDLRRSSKQHMQLYDDLQLLSILRFPLALKKQASSFGLLHRLTLIEGHVKERASCQLGSLLSPPMVGLLREYEALCLPIVRL